MAGQPKIERAILSLKEIIATAELRTLNNQNQDAVENYNSNNNNNNNNNIVSTGAPYLTGYHSSSTTTNSDSVTVSNDPDKRVVSNDITK